MKELVDTLVNRSTPLAYRRTLAPWSLETLLIDGMDSRHSSDCSTLQAVAVVRLSTWVCATFHSCSCKTTIIPQEHTMVSLSSAQRVWVWFWILKTLLYPPRNRWGGRSIFHIASFWRVHWQVVHFSTAFRLRRRSFFGNPLKLQSITLMHKNVVVASAFEFHFDVYMPIVWTLQRIMLKDQGNLQGYAATPFHFKFQEVVDQYGLC